jgi:hypothetical protein
MAEMQRRMVLQLDMLHLAGERFRYFRRLMMMDMGHHRRFNDIPHPTGYYKCELHRHLQSGGEYYHGPTVRRTCRPLVLADLC